MHIERPKHFVLVGTTVFHAICATYQRKYRTFSAVGRSRDMQSTVILGVDDVPRNKLSRDRNLEFISGCVNGRISSESAQAHVQQKLPLTHEPFRRFTCLCPLSRYLVFLLRLVR